MMDFLRNFHAQGGPGRDMDQRAIEEMITSPFVATIAQAPKSQFFTEPVFRPFDGSSDPVSHLGHYVERMSYYEGDDSALCRSFASSLGDKGLEWYRRLPAGQISNFRELSISFVARFRDGRIGPKNLADLYALKKKKDESLRAYSNKFWDLYDAVESPPQPKIDAFKSGLLGEPQLFDSLVLDPPTTHQGLAERAERYILLEESRKRLMNNEAAVSNPQSDTINRGNQHPTGKGNALSRLGNRPDNRITQQAATANPLLGQVNVIFNTPLPQILKEVKHKSFFLPPRPMLTASSNRNTKLRCEYHKDHGHRTQDCVTLRRHLVELVDRGHLQKYVQEDNRKQPVINRNPDHGETVEKELSDDTIN
jgi:hypothetical protein